MIYLSQYTKDNIQKKMKSILFFKKEETINNKIKGVIKINDRLTILRLHQIWTTMKVAGNIIQKITTTTEHEKEKKIIKKHKEIGVYFQYSKQMEKTQLLFTDIKKKIIKFKIYKKFSLIVYISMPSIKIKFMLNSIKRILQRPYIIKNNN